jgi:hypothetical protein
LRADGVLPEREAIPSPALSALLLISEEIASTAVAHYTALFRNDIVVGWNMA